MQIKLNWNLNFLHLCHTIRKMISIRICCFLADKTTDTSANKKILLTIFLASILIFFFFVNFVLFITITGMLLKHPFCNSIFPTPMPYIYPDYMICVIIFPFQHLTAKTANIYPNNAMLINYIGKLMLSLAI